MRWDLSLEFKPDNKTVAIPTYPPLAQHFVPSHSLFSRPPPSPLTMSSPESSPSTTPGTPTSHQQPPTLTIFSRVASIPLVNESLATIHAVLVGSRYTSVPYVTAQNLGKSVYHISEPIQIRLAPVLIRADGLANKSLDAVQSYYPTPFTITSEELRSGVQERREHAFNTANKALDDRVRGPAYSAAQAIDQVQSKF